MSPEEFEKLLERAPCDEFVAAINPLDEASRKSHLRALKAARKEMDQRFESGATDGSTGDWQIRQKLREKWLSGNPYIQSNIVLGLLACGSAADARRVRIWELRWEWQDLVASVLIARNPVWLDTWVKNGLDGEEPELSWELVRAMLNAGVIDKPTSDGYVTLFVSAMRGYEYDKPESYIPTSERLIAEPEFLEDEVWRIFKAENHALTTDWNARGQGGPANYETWPEAILRLANDGHLDRDRLLDVTLESMQQEMKQNQLSAFGKLHEALGPGTDEMKVREQGYLDLLVSPIGPVLSFAVKMLGKLQRADELDPDLFLDAVLPVFSHKAKGTAMQSLKICEKLDDDPRRKQKKMSVAVAAMSHASPDVQEFALGMLEKDMDAADDTTRDEFARKIAFLATKLQLRANAISGAKTEVLDDGEDDRDLSASLQEVESLPADLRKALGLQTPIAESIPTALDYNILDLPCPAERKRLQPIATQEGLLELAAQLIESVESPEQVEVLLDGIAHYGRTDSADFRKLSAPLMQRLQTGQTSSNGLCAEMGGVSTALIDLLMNWWTGDRYDSRGYRYYNETPQEAFSTARIREVQALLIQGYAAPLLATPSYYGGWIDPEDLVDRLCELIKSEGKVSRCDLMQALLRLGPGNRHDALQAAAGLPGDAARVVRFALGGDDAPERQDKKIAHVWFCAARARDPQGPLDELLGPVASKVPKLPGIFSIADGTWSVNVVETPQYRHAKIVFGKDSTTTVDMGSIYKRSVLKEAKKRLTEPKWALWPTAALRTWPEQGWYAFYHYGSPWRIEWLAMQHPTDSVSYMSLAARMLDMRSDENTSRDAPVHTFLAALFDATRPWDNMGVLALSLGLLSRSADSRGYAIDALIPGIESGHADFLQIAESLARLLENGAYKINRFQTAMSAVLDVSDLHKWWVARLVDEIVEQLNTLPKGAHYLYDVALECMLPLQMRPSAAMTARLKEHKGSSKTAKLARELLALEGPSIREPGNAIVAAAWLGRLQLAKGFLS